MRLWRVVLAAIALGALSSSGCATARVQSVHSPDFRGPVSRLAVVIGEGRYPQDARQLSTYLERQLSERQIPNRIVVVGSDTPVDSLTFDDFQPDAVLTIAPTAIIRAPNGDRLRVRYDAGLWPKAQPGKRVWRAEIEHENTGIFFPGRESGMPERLEVTAARLVENLEADGMLARRKVVAAVSP